MTFPDLVMSFDPSLDPTMFQYARNVKINGGAFNVEQNGTSEKSQEQWVPL